MSKLTKAQAKSHATALEIVRRGQPLTEDEKYFVLNNYQESATNVNSLAGAFFTPEGMARDFAVEVYNCDRLIDLCAGIGRLAFHLKEKAKHITCVELNPEYIEVGKAILPEATWIQADVLSISEFEKYDIAISNPPFGKIKTSGWTDKYKGAEFEYKVIEKASKIANYGVFILPQMSTPFKYSGVDGYKTQKLDKYIKFNKETGIEIGANCGIDTSIHKDDWHGVSPVCEIATVEFCE